MPSITVQLTKTALKDLEGLADPVRSGVLSCISRLQDDPLPDGQSIKKLKGFALPLRLGVSVSKIAAKAGKLRGRNRYRNRYRNYLGP